MAMGLGGNLSASRGREKTIVERRLGEPAEKNGFVVGGEGSGI